MKLSQLALLKVKSNKRLRNRIAFELDKTSMTIFRWIKENDANLTRADVLQMIREETGLKDAEILEDVTKKIAA